MLATRVPVFSTLLSDLGFELPAATRFVLLICRPSAVWAATVAAVTFLVVKELRVVSLRTRVLWNCVVFLATAGVAAVVAEALFQPLFEILQQIG